MKTIPLPLYLILLLTLPSLQNTLSPTLQDLVQDPIPLYRDPSSILIDTVQPEHLNTVGADVIQSETGDFNGDGIDDLIVIRDTYKFYVVFGTPTGFPEYSVKSKLDEQDGFQIVVKDTQHFLLKEDVKFIGDVNGDGLADILASIKGVDKRAYIIYGSKDRFPSNVIDPMESTRVLFSGYKDSQVVSFSGIGDFNGDGIDDFVIVNEPNMKFFFGSKSLSSKVANYTDIQAETQKLTITSYLPANTCFGAKLAKAGDFNGDGFADFMMSIKCDKLEYAGQSKVYVFYGQKTFPETFAMNLLGTSGYPRGLVIEAQEGWDFFGSKIEPVGDFNGDGLDDIMISSMSFINQGSLLTGLGRNKYQGGTYIFFGKKDLNGTLPPGILKSRPELGVYIQQAGHQIAAIGDLNKDGYQDILITDDSVAHILYGEPNFSKNFSVLSIDGKNGFTITSPTISRIQSVVGVGDINGDGSPDFAYTNVWKKYFIITKDLPKATACFDIKYCFASEAEKYLDFNFCAPESPPPVQKDDEKSKPNPTTPTEATAYSCDPAIQEVYNKATQGVYDKETQGVYNKATEHVVSKDTENIVSKPTENVVSKDKMSASTAALCGTAIGAGISAIIFLLGGAVRKWYKEEGNYMQLEEQTTGSMDWNLESCKMKIYEIEEAINKKFKCYKFLLWGLLVFEILTILYLFVDMDAFDAYFIARLMLHCFKAFAFGKAIEALKKVGLEKQKRVVLSMKILYGLGCIFLVLHTMALYQKLKPHWYLPETGLQFAMAVLFLAIFSLGTQLVVCLYAQKFLKLLVKREELREQLGSSRVEMQSPEEQRASSPV